MEKDGVYCRICIVVNGIGKMNSEHFKTDERYER